MMTLKALKSRREGIEKINKIARAMEVIAATRLHHHERRVLRFRPYILAAQSVMGNLALRLKKINSPWTTSPGQNKKSLAILISSARGFCGGFNNQLFQLIKGLEDKEAFSFIAIGKKGAAFLKKQDFNLINEYELPPSTQLPEFVQEIVAQAVIAYREEQKGIYLVFNQFRRNLLGQAMSRQVLPLQTKEQKGMALDYLFEPDAEVVVKDFLSLYVNLEIKAAIFESQAAEEMARMVAMTQASRSAQDLIRNLTLQYHKARQAGITKELIEIVSAI